MSRRVTCCLRGADGNAVEGRQRRWKLVPCARQGQAGVPEGGGAGGDGMACDAASRRLCSSIGAGQVKREAHVLGRRRHRGLPAPSRHCLLLVSALTRCSCLQSSHTWTGLLEETQQPALNNDIHR